MSQLFTQLTESLTGRCRLLRADAEQQLVAMELPSAWNHGNLILRVDENTQSIDLVAMVGGKVPPGAQSVVTEALRLANDYCKFGSFVFVGEFSQIMLRSSCVAVGGLNESQLFFLISALATYWDRVGYAIQSIIRENVLPGEAIQGAFQAG